MRFLGSSLLAGTNAELQLMSTSLRYLNYASNCWSLNVVSNCPLVILITSYFRGSFFLNWQKCGGSSPIHCYPIIGCCFHYVFANSGNSCCRCNLIRSNIGNNKLCELKLSIKSASSKNFNQYLPKICAY